MRIAGQWKQVRQVQMEYFHIRRVEYFSPFIIIIIIIIIIGVSINCVYYELEN